MARSLGESGRRVHGAMTSAFDPKQSTRLSAPAGLMKHLVSACMLRQQRRLRQSNTNVRVDPFGLPECIADSASPHMAHCYAAPRRRADSRGREVTCLWIPRWITTATPNGAGLPAPPPPRLIGMDEDCGPARDVGKPVRPVNSARWCVVVRRHIPAGPRV